MGQWPDQLSVVCEVCEVCRPIAHLFRLKIISPHPEMHYAGKEVAEIPNWLVTAFHRHDDVGTLSQLVCEQLWAAVDQIDPKLAHDFDDLEVHVFAGSRAGRRGGVPSTGHLLEEGLADL
jgi:hypothetical protein